MELLGIFVLLCAQTRKEKWASCHVDGDLGTVSLRETCQNNSWRTHWAFPNRCFGKVCGTLMPRARGNIYFTYASYTLITFFLLLQVQVQLPPLNKLRIIVDRLQALQSDLMLVQSDSLGTLQVSATNDDVSVMVEWHKLQNPPISTSIFWDSCDYT